MRTRAAGEPHGIGRVSIALLVGLCILLLGVHASAENAIDLQAFVQETQKFSRDPQKMTLIWWVPEQFWQASLTKNPQVSEAQVEAFLKVIRRYTMLAVADGLIGPFGGVTFQSEDAIRRSVTVRDMEGAVQLPLGEAAIDQDTKNLLQMLKPVLANLLGSMGQNMHFVLFTAQTKDGHPVADPKGKGTFTVVLGGKEYSYRLPLGSVLPPRYDPTTGEQFPGNYLYNPFTGGTLTTQPASK